MEPNLRKSEISKFKQALTQYLQQIKRIHKPTNKLKPSQNFQSKNIQSYQANNTNFDSQYEAQSKFQNHQQIKPTNKQKQIQSSQGTKRDYFNEQNIQMDNDDQQKGKFQNISKEEERSIKTTKQQFDWEEQPIKASQKNEPENIANWEDRPINVKNQPIDLNEEYQIEEDELPKVKVKKQQKKTTKQKKDVLHVNEFEEQPIIEKKSQNLDDKDTEAPQQKGKKKVDEKVKDNLEKRVKYDPRKAIEQEKERKIKEAESQQLKQTHSANELNQQEENTKKDLKTVVSEQQIKKDVIAVQEGEKENSLDEPRNGNNFLKRKTKQVESQKLNWKKIESKVNCWTNSQRMNSPQKIEQSFPGPQQVQGEQKSPLRQQSPIMTQCINNIQCGYNKSPIRSPVKERKKNRITIEDLERTYMTSYSQKLECIYQIMRIGFKNQRNLNRKGDKIKWSANNEKELRLYKKSKLKNKMKINDKLTYYLLH